MTKSYSSDVVRLLGSMVSILRSSKCLSGILFLLQTTRSIVGRPLLISQINDIQQQNGISGLA